MNNTPGKFFELAESFLECVKTGLSDGLGPELVPSIACVRVGEFAWDNCDCGGMLAVIPGNPQYANAFPMAAEFSTDVSPCGPTYIMSPYTVAILRCAPTVKQSARAPIFPTCAEQQAYAQQVLLDAHYVRNSLLCCLQTMRDDYIIADFTVAGTEYVGPDGGCGGSYFNFTVGLANACPCG